MLLSTSEFSGKLEAALINSEDSIIVLSGFVKANALKWLLELSDPKSIRVVSRWRKHDLKCGASDFECYQICKSANVDFGISLDLHGKVYCVDSQIFVGSSNLTSRGMSLTNNFNDEFGVGFVAGGSDFKKVQSYLSNITWLDDTLADEIRLELANTSEIENVFDQDWSPSLRAKISQPIQYLWMHELLFSTPGDILHFNARNEYQVHDYELLGLHLDNISAGTLVSAFRNSSSYKWLDGILDQEKSLSFGAVSAKLHDAILDDPSPYRKQVKQLVSNLFSWFSIVEGYRVSRPRHSQVIEKLNNA